MQVVKEFTVFIFLEKESIKCKKKLELKVILTQLLYLQEQEKVPFE